MAALNMPRVLKVTSSIIDFYVASSSMSRVVTATTTCADHPGGPHKPVQFMAKANAGDLCQLVARAHGKIPCERVFGPCNRGVDWSVPLAVAQKAAIAAKESSLYEAKALMDTAYALFANGAERELMACTDVVLKRPGLRAVMPQLHYSPVMNRIKTLDDDICIQKGWQWLEHVSREIHQTMHDNALSAQQKLNLGEYAGIIAGHSYI